MKNLLQTDSIKAVMLLILISVTPNALRAQNSFVIAPGSNVVVPGTLVLRNTDLLADGSLDATAGAVIFKGNNSNSLEGAMMPVIGTLVVDKPGGLALGNDLQVATQIDFQNGVIALNGNTITLNSSAILQSENESNRITGTGGGMVTTTIMGVSNPSQLDPGNLGASITSAATLGDLTVSRTNFAAATPGQMSIQRVYQIDPQNNTALNATLRFHYFDAEMNGTDENTLVLWQSPDNITWTQAGYDSRDAAANYVEKAGINSFSYWTLTNDANPLPLSLVYFSAFCETSHALIDWETKNETGVSRFEIEKSKDAATWYKIHETAATNDQDGASYSWADTDPLPRAWYRIRIIEHTGKETYSPVFSGGCADIGIPFTVYPNPTPDVTAAKITVRQGGASFLQVYDAAGAKVMSVPWELQAGTNEYPLSLSDLSAGTYTVKLVFGTETFTVRAIKL